MKAPIARSTSTNSIKAADHQLKPPFAMPGSNKPPPSPAPATPVLPRMKATVTVPGASPQPLHPPSRSSTPSLYPSITRSASTRKLRSETILPSNMPSPTPSRPLAGPASGNRSSSLTSKVATKKLAPANNDGSRSRPGTSLGGERAQTPMFFHARNVQGPEKGAQSQPKFFFADQSTLDDDIPGPRLKPTPPSPRVGTRASVLPMPSSKITITPPQTRPASVVGPPTPRANPPKSQPLTPSTAPDHRSHVKFVYANGTEEILEPRRIGGESESSEGSHQFPSSPHSSNQSSGTSTTKMGPLTPLSSPGTIASIPQLFAQRPMAPDTVRRPSFDSGRARHGRAMSLGSTSDFKLHAGLSGLASPSEEAELDNAAVMDTPASPPPLSGAQQKIKEMEARAAEARRERKVMDLEISNTSLLAINRSLERQMRKQASQLRRYKRLARSGRFPTAGLDGHRSSFSSNRPGSPALSETASSVDSRAIADESDDEDALSKKDSSVDPSLASRSDDEDEGDETETETLGNSESETDDEDEDDEDGGDVEKHRASDERRLNADLAKHKALLEASAKMNASLRRCQLVTDQLIADAKKALEYSVQPCEVRLGGRVVYRDDDDVDVDEDDDVEIDSPYTGDRGFESDNFKVPPPYNGANKFKGGPVIAQPRGPVATGYRMAIPEPSTDTRSESEETDFDDAASAFGELYDGDKYDTETESEWDGESEMGSEMGVGLGIGLPDVGSVGSGPRYKLV